MATRLYTDTDIDRLVTRYLEGADRDQLNPILDACVAVYTARRNRRGEISRPEWEGTVVPLPSG